MSRHATDWAWETDPGSSSLKLILLSMADRADEYNLCYPSIERLVKDTCLNKKTVQAGLISLMKMGLISDTGERKGATKRVRVFSLNITKNGNIKGNREGSNEPENGNVTENGNIPKNGMLNDPKNGMNRPGFPGECFICELRLPDHRFRWKHNKLFLLLPEEYGPAFPAIVDCYTSPPT
ncbi:hypothetical protein BFQ11_22230 [Escherichia coli]|nr:hypothetical protein BFQ11_22230 [Escherichia coli]